MDRLLDPDRAHLVAWVSTHDIVDSFLPFESFMRPKISPLLCSPFNSFVVSIPSWNTVITRRQDSNASRGDQGTPLHVVVSFGHTAMRLLDFC
jgi:hypothetical protein